MRGWNFRKSTKKQMGIEGDKMSKFYSMSTHGITINYKCYKLKIPFRKLCEYKDPKFSDCVSCKYFRAEMLAKDAQRLIRILHSEATE